MTIFSTRCFSLVLAVAPSLFAATPAAALEPRFAVARHNADGSLDTSFDGDGKVLTDFASLPMEWGSAVTVDGLGRIIVAGLGNTSSDPDIEAHRVAVARYTADGNLDETFDGDGKVITDFASSTWEAAAAVAVQPDGKIVVAGRAEVAGKDHFALVRYNEDGSLDTSFDGDGKVLTDFASSNGVWAGGVLVTGAGKIVVCGGAHMTGGTQFALARYNSNGSLDTSFDADGKVLTDFASAGDESATSCAFNSAGKVVAGGIALFSSGSQFALARYNLNGSLDTAFDGDGKVLTDWSASAEEAIHDITVDASDRIVAAGYLRLAGAGFVLGVARYHSTGRLDSSFGGGTVATDLPESGAEEATSVAVDANGRIVVAGAAHSGGGYQFMLTRYTSAGALDASFDGDGRVLTNFATMVREVAVSLVIDAAGRLVSAGYAWP